MPGPLACYHARMMRRQKTGKLVPLEGLRGIAAVVVMLGHIVRGLVPPGPGALDVLNRVHHWVLNGGAAVSVFFVLSGLILSLPFAKDRSLMRVGVALLKRWPRLAALTTIACLFSWLMILVSQDAHEQAAAVTGNYWMASHFNAPLRGYDTSLVAALNDGLWGVFLFGDVRFDSPLWTMRIELFGSFGIYLVAPVLFWLKRWPLRLAAIGGMMIAVGTSPPLAYFSDFLVGAILAMLFAEGRMPHFSNWKAAVMAVAGIYLFCFSAEEARLLYAPLKVVIPSKEAAHFAWDLSAALIIAVLFGSPVLSRVFSKNWAVRLGELSFPLYVLHVPVMLSAGALTFVGTAAALGVTGAVLLAGAVTVVLTMICSLPLAWVDEAWTMVLGRVTKRLVKGRAAIPMTAPALPADKPDADR